jgi:hypothetical protein
MISDAVIIIFIIPCNVTESPGAGLQRLLYRPDAGPKVAQRYGHRGLPDDAIHIRCHGTASRSFGAFLAHSINLELAGQARSWPIPRDEEILARGRDVVVLGGGDTDAVGIGTAIR